MTTNSRLSLVILYGDHSLRYSWCFYYNDSGALLVASGTSSLQGCASLRSPLGTLCYICSAYLALYSCMLVAWSALYFSALQGWQPSTGKKIPQNLCLPPNLLAFKRLTNLEYNSTHPHLLPDRVSAFLGTRIPRPGKSILEYVEFIDQSEQSLAT